MSSPLAPPPLAANAGMSPGPPVAAFADGFSQTAFALIATFELHADLLTSHPAQFSNYVLDLCGSDRRPLVQLLQWAAPTIRHGLATSSARIGWETRRAPLVHQLVATLYLQPDVARWVVDAWGAALGVAPRSVNRPTLQSVDSAPSHASGAEVAARSSHGPPPPLPRAIAPLVPPRTARQTNRGAKPTTTYPGATAQATYANASMIGATYPVHPATARPIAPRWRTLSPAMTSGQLAQLRRVERWSLAAIVMAGIGVFIAAALALAGRKTETVAAAAVLPVIITDSPTDSAMLSARSPMHSLPVTSPSPQAHSTDQNIGSADSLLLSLSTPIVAQMHASLLPPPPRGVSGAQLIAAGVAGRYRVEQRVRSVSGSPSCDQVAAALANGRVSIEVITHTPGAFTFAIPTRTVNGVLDADANFDAGPREGTTDGVSWRFSMRGQFTASGFVAETQTSTDAIIRWGRTQSCMTVADLVAERIAP